MASAVRILRRAVLVVAALVGGLVALLLLVYVGLKSGVLAPVVDDLVGLFARKQGVFFVRAEGVSGNLPEHLVVKKVEVGDADEVWLTIEDAEAHWHPFDLFHPFDDVQWRIHVDDIRARRVTWTDLPVTEDDEDDEPFRWDRFIRILAGQLFVEELVVGENLLAGSGPARVRAEGSGVLGEWEHGFLDLDLTHVDDVAGSVSIDLKTFGSPVRLEGTVHAEEADGGALARLARLAGAGALDLDVRASGPLSDWSVAADVTLEAIGRLEADADLAFVSGGPFGITGTFDPVASIRQRTLLGDGAPITLAVHGSFAPGEALRLDRAELVSDGRRLDASGRLDLVSDEFELHGELAHRSGELVETTVLALESAKLDARGSLADGGRLEATLAVDSPVLDVASADELRAMLKATDPAGDGAASFELSASASGLELDGEMMPLLGGEARLVAEGRVDLEAGLLATEEVLLEGGALRIAGPLSLRDGWSAMNATLSADASTLGSLRRYVGASVQGSAAASVELAAREDWQDFQLRVRAGTRDVKIAEAGWNALLGGDSTFAADVGGALAGALKGNLELATSGIRATAEGEVGEDGERLSAEARFSLDNLSRLAEPTRAAIAGRVEGRASATGSVDDFDVEATVRGHRFSFEGVRFDTLTVDATATGLPEAWSAEVRSNARYGQLEASLDAAVSMPDQNRLKLSRVVLRGPRTEGNADLEIALDDGVAAGNVRLASQELSLWRPMTGQAIGGTLAIDATLSSSGNGKAATQRISGRTNAKNLIVPLGEAQLFVDALDAKAEALEVGPNPRGTAIVRATDVRYVEQTLVEGTLEVRGDGRAWNVETSLDLRGGDDVAVEVSGSVVPGPPLEGRLTRLTGALEGRALELQSPVTFTYEAPEAWSVERLALRVGESGAIRAGGQSKPSGLRIDAELDALPLALASLFSTTLDLEGTVDGSVRLQGPSLEAARGEVSLRGSGVTTRGFESQGVSPVDVQVDARLGDGRVSGTAALQGIGDSRLRLLFQAPTDVASGTAPFEADLVWKGQLADTLALVPIGDNVVKGLVDAELRLTGTLDAPRVSGRAVVEDGRWEQPAAGLVLAGLRAELVGSGTSLVLRRFEANDTESGSVRASGSVHFGQLPAFTAELDVEATDAVLTRLELATTRADASLALRASRGEGDDAEVEGSISGEVRLIDVRIAIPQSFASDIPEIQVVEVGAETAAGSVMKPARPFALDLDIGVRGDNRIFVTGRGTESEWSADLQVGGDTTDPRVVGTITSVRGQLGLLGRRFDVTSGTLRFDGSQGNMPYLSLTARAEANDITAIAEVTGPATTPSIELRSEPALPRDEVLSRVLFGQSAASLTPMQSVALARSVAELTGGPLGGGGDLLGGIGRSLGLDRLDIGSGSDGAAALTASKYLTDDVYLNVQGGLTPEDSKLSLEWRVTDHITIESDVSQDAQGEVGATWRWDY